MNMIISIPDNAAKKPLENNLDFTHTMLLALMTGIRLPDNPTNGNIFCLFNNVSRVIELRDCVEVEVEVRPSIIWTSQFDKEWWNTKWEGVQEQWKR